MRLADAERVLGASQIDSRDGSFELRLSAEDAEAVYRIRAVDPSTGAVSGTAEVGVPDESDPPNWVVLQLRDTFLIHGTVVDRSGETQPGRQVRIKVAGTAGGWSAAEGFPEEVDTITDTNGRFSVRVRRGGGSGRVAVRGADGVWGWPLDYNAPDADALDVGTIIDPSGESVVWRLHMKSDGGAPCAGAVVKLSVHDFWNARSHPSYDTSDSWIRGGADGLVHLRLPVRERPALVAVGALRHVTRALLLDCSRAGEHDVVVQLRPKLAVRLRLVGDAVPELLKMDVRVALGQWPPGSPHREFECVDALTGEPAAIPRLQGAGPPTEGLDDNLRRLERSRLPVAPGVFEAYVPVPGDYTADVSYGSVGWFLFQTRVRITGREAVETVETIDLPVPRGRRAVLDVTDLDRWSSAAGRGVWFARYCAWPYVPERSLEEGDVPSLEETHGAVDLLSGEDRCGAHQVQLWLPAGTDSVGFGFLRGGALYAPGSRASDVVYYGVPGDDVPRFVAPVPSVSHCTVTISLHRGGVPTKQAGISVELARADDRLHDWLLSTDRAGAVRAHLQEGTYVARVAHGAVKSPPVPFEVRAGIEFMEVRLDWDFAVE